MKTSLYIDDFVVVDIYKNIESKLDEISVNDSKSVSYLNSLKWLNFQFVFYKLSLFEVSEKLALKYNFYVDEMPRISSFDLDKYFNGDFNNFINDKIFQFLISKMNEFSNLKIDNNDYNTIYDNLLYVSMFDILTPYLNKKQLEFILSNFNRIDSNNILISNNIKMLIKKRITKYK